MYTKSTKEREACTISSHLVLMVPQAVLNTKKLVKFSLSTQKVGNQSPVIARWANSRNESMGILLVLYNRRFSPCKLKYLKYEKLRIGTHRG